MITKYFVQSVFTIKSDLFIAYSLNLLASIPLPVYSSVCFTSILFFHAFDHTGLDLVGFGLSLARLGWSRS